MLPACLSNHHHQAFSSSSCFGCGRVGSCVFGWALVELSPARNKGAAWYLLQLDLIDLDLEGVSEALSQGLSSWFPHAQFSP